MLANQERYKEFLTSTSKNIVVDHLMDAMEKGKEFMRSLQESFDQMICEVFIHKIKTDLIEKQMQKFFIDSIIIQRVDRKLKHSRLGSYRITINIWKSARSRLWIDTER
ncbi:MAG: hypothetical protein ACMUEM_02480 [Flavobacteriales bacterium AspAUS03]